MNSFQVTIKGLSPLLMHSTRGMDPFDELAKKKAGMKDLTSDAKKLDANIIKGMELDFKLAIYHDGRQPVMPAENILGALVEGGKRYKKKAAVRAGVILDRENYPLEYDGPKGLDELFADRAFVDLRTAVNKSTKGRIHVCRPRFNTWAVTFDVLFEPDVIDYASLCKCIEYAGRFVGLGAFRPRFGRFEVIECKPLDFSPTPNTRSSSSDSKGSSTEPRSRTKKSRS